MKWYSGIALINFSPILLKKPIRAQDCHKLCPLSSRLRPVCQLSEQPEGRAEAGLRNLGPDPVLPRPEVQRAEKTPEKVAPVHEPNRERDQE